MRRLFLKMTGAAAVGALVGACGGTDDDDDETAGTLLALSARSGEISALAAAARRAGLEAALDAPDANLTVLAPTNDAWGLLAGQLGYRTIQDLLDALPPATVEAILLYHVLPGRVSRADLLAGGSQATLLQQGGSTVSLSVDTTPRASITDTVGRIAFIDVFDVPADNGVFHLIDRVLIPSGLLTVLQTLQSNTERFSSLLGAALGLPTPNAVRDALAGTSPVTLFAPVNEAFEAPAVAQLLPTLQPEQVSLILRHHVLAGEMRSSAIPFGTPVSTLAGQQITISAGGTAIATIDDSSATDANITQVDILCSNGVVHVIDKVLLPTLG